MMSASLFSKTNYKQFHILTADTAFGHTYFHRRHSLAAPRYHLPLQHITNPSHIYY